jgi:hypothetical protein
LHIKTRLSRVSIVLHDHSFFLADSPVFPPADESVLAALVLSDRVLAAFLADSSFPLRLHPS